LLALSAKAEELDAVIRDREPGAGRHARRQGARVRLGHRRVDVDDPSAALAHEVMMRAGVGVEARVGTGQLLEQPRADEYPEIAVNRAQARAGQAAANESPFVFPK
jgi:hypothetical protein